MPFQPSIAQRALLYPVDHALEERQFEALSAAAAVIGEREAYYLLTEAVDEELEIALEFPLEFPLDDYVSYAGAVRVSDPFEAAVFSCEGTWGLLFSRDTTSSPGERPSSRRPGSSAFPRAQTHRRRWTSPRRSMRHGPAAAILPTSTTWRCTTRRTGTDPSRSSASQHAIRSAPSRPRSADSGTSTGRARAWLGLLLEHLYGQVEACEILTRAGLGGPG